MLRYFSFSFILPQMSGGCCWLASLISTACLSGWFCNNSLASDNDWGSSINRISPSNNRPSRSSNDRLSSSTNHIDDVDFEESGLCSASLNFLILMRYLIAYANFHKTLWQKRVITTNDYQCDVSKIIRRKKRNAESFTCPSL